MRWNLFNKKQQWLCGRAAEGKPCRGGPDYQGHCQTQFECQPLKKGDRWYCSRSTPCSTGALPNGECARKSGYCSAQLSGRAKLLQLNIWGLALAVSLMLFMLAATLYSPGKLSVSHDFLSDTCVDCHSTGSYEGIQVLMQAFQDSSHDKENALCVDCHQLGKSANLAHSLDLTQLENLTEQARQAKADKGHNLTMVELGNSLTSNNPESSLSCMSCHREHQGTEHNLLSMSDKKCQSCHQQSFLHFKDHPEFTDYPYAHSTALQFNHSAHIVKHFKEPSVTALSPENCNDCHQPDTKGELMTVKGFEQTCSGCHLAQIQGSSQAETKGIAVLGLLGMDVETLRAKGYIVGAWPEDADSQLSVFMRLLLAQDTQATKALITLQGIDTLDLRSASKPQLQAASDLIWAIKGFFLTLQKQGHSGLKQQLESVLARELSATEFSGLSSLLAPSLLNEAVDQWFPQLSKEVTYYQQHDYRAIKALTLLEIEPSSVDSLPVVSKLSSAENNDDLLEDDTDLLLDDDDLGGDLLGDDNDLLAEDDSLLDMDMDLEESTETNSPLLIELKNISAEEWVNAGGWYRAYDSLYYRPSVHADKFLKSWLDLTVGMENKPALQAVFEKISAPKAQGMCLKCHSVQDNKISWQAKHAEQNVQGFTRYAHDRHLTMDKVENCAMCHQLSEFEVTDDKPANFKAMSKTQCETCHNEQSSVTESCSNCHNYHIGSVELKLKKTELDIYRR